MSGSTKVSAMYTQLLEAVLAYEDDAPSLPRSQGPLADAVRLRRSLERHLGRTDPGWALQAVADQLAYDAALVRLARHRGLTVGLDSFDRPGRGRTAIETALVGVGVRFPHRADPDGDPAPAPATDTTPAPSGRPSV